MTLPFADLELSYEALAQAIDRVGPEREALFLAKLALLLCDHIGDHTAIEAAIARAEADLAP